jgi:hypothetical protein
VKSLGAVDAVLGAEGYRTAGVIHPHPGAVVGNMEAGIVIGIMLPLAAFYPGKTAKLQAEEI